MARIWTRHATLCEGLYSYGQDLDKTRDSLRRVQTAIDALDGTIGFLLLSVVENYNYFVLATDNYFVLATDNYFVLAADNYFVLAALHYFVLADVCGSGGVIDP